MRGLALLLCLSLGAADEACRCPERALTEYFGDAHEVFVGTLVRAEDHAEGLRRFHFERIGEAYRLKRTSAATPDPGDPGNETLVGLLDVAAFTHASEVPLFEAPDSESATAGRVSSYAELEQRESGYEVDAAVVFAVVDGWYRVRRADGAFAWLPPGAAGTYWPLDDLLPGRLAYLTTDWNRWIWPQAGAGNPTRVSYAAGERPREQMVNLLGASRVGDALWLEVEVLDSNPCEGQSESIRVRGWVPAYGETGDPVAWYYSRGC